MMTILITIAFFVIVVIACSFMEWYIHGKFMHGKWPTKRLQNLANYLFQDKHKEHHRDYPSHSYKNSDHGPNVNLPLWGGMIIVSIMTIPGLILSYITSIWTIVWCFALTSAFYFWAYNYVHTCLHVPTGRWFETTKLYNVIDVYHHTHHVLNVKWGSLVNICIICPLADFVMRTSVDPSNKI